MLKALVLTAVAGLIGLGSTVASAMCTGGYVADCGDFRVLSTSCPISNESGDIIGHSEDFSAVFNDASRPEAPFKLSSAVEVQPALYRAVLNSDSDLYIAQTSVIAANGRKEDTFQTYKVEWGKQSPTTECIPMHP